MFLKKERTRRYSEASMERLEPIYEMDLIGDFVNGNDDDDEDEDDGGSFTSSLDTESVSSSTMMATSPADGQDGFLEVPSSKEQLAVYQQMMLENADKRKPAVNSSNSSSDGRDDLSKKRRNLNSWGSLMAARDVIGDVDKLVGDAKLDYLPTMMYGRYTRDLGHYAKEEARRLKALERRRKRQERLWHQELGMSERKGRIATALTKATGAIWNKTFARLGEDWVFLAILGVTMAFVSFAMDYGIAMCNKARLWLFRDLATHPAVQFFAWVCLPVFLVLFSAGFVHIVAPQSIGSGIPEMKTILRGVVLKEYLTFRTFIAKVVGLTAALGSGMPLGKEGPFVHVASIVATLISKMVTSFHRLIENESRNAEMLAAACAVGVACCFAAPVGGVLFSIEVTTVYFAVRNYWRGFFAAVCGSMTFRLLAVWFHNQDTITPVFKTHLSREFPFDPQELVVFALIGLACGLGGAGYVWCHRQYVLFMRKSKRMNRFLQKNRFVYPLVVSLAISAIHFPLGMGQFLAADLDTHSQVTSLFSNFSWSRPHLTVSEAAMVDHWVTPYTGIFVNLTLFMIVTFWTSIIASTLPVPSGLFVPLFKMGAAFGRLVGEAFSVWFPAGIRVSGPATPILPGGYAVVGAAALSGAMTHTISTSVIAFEMTGQVTHLIPVMVAVLVANAVAALLQPSLYDSIILIKKLPYFPDILPSNSGAYGVHVEDFMVRDVHFIWKGMTYLQLKEILRDQKQVRYFPLVETPDSMILLGSIQRLELVKVIDRHIGRERRLQIAARWQREAQERAYEEMKRRQREEEMERLKQRRPSRFEVVPAPDVLRFRDRQPGVHEANGMMVTVHGDEAPTLSPSIASLDARPKKSILKKTNSFSLRSFSPFYSPFQQNNPYSTVTGAESRLRIAFDTIFRKSATLPDADENTSITSTKPTIGSSSPATVKKVQLPRERVIDMSPEEQQAWEEEELNKRVCFDRCRLDPAPFQLVEKTTLLKVHSLFSMLSLELAYVTNAGRLVGVVALKELRKAIEDCNAGTPPGPRTEDKEKPPIPTVIVSDGNDVNNMETITSVDSALSGTFTSYADDDDEEDVRSPLASP